jgi:hypothetical protein
MPSELFFFKLSSVPTLKKRKEKKGTFYNWTGLWELRQLHNFMVNVCWQVARFSIFPGLCNATSSQRATGYLSHWLAILKYHCTKKNPLWTQTFNFINIKLLLLMCSSVLLLRNLICNLACVCLFFVFPLRVAKAFTRIEMKCGKYPSHSSGHSLWWPELLLWQRPLPT